MNTQPIISIIIVSWNVSELLEKCLESIVKTSMMPIEIFVIDNNSHDDTNKMMNDFIKKKSNSDTIITFIQNAENKGFAYANNQAFKKARGKYLLLLNPDTELMPGTLLEVIEYMKSNPSIGVTGCKHLNPDGTIQRSVRNFPTLLSQIFILLKIHHIFPNLFSLKKYFAKDFDYSVTQKVDQVAGSFFMISRMAFEKIGFFDEKFHIWFEEVDYCKRLANENLNIYYVADASIIHHGGSSFKQVVPFTKQKVFLSSLLRYFHKHHSSLSLHVIQFFYIPSLILSLIPSVFMWLDKRHK